MLTCLRHEARAAESLHHVRLVYFWPVQGFLLIPIVVAQEQGIYRKYGLDVSIVLPPDAQTTARMLATGQAEIGMEARTDVVFAAEVSLPLISIANYDQHNSWCVVGRPGEVINLGALEGKKIGIFTDSWTAVMMHLLFEKTGVKKPDNVQQIITQFEDLPLLLSGRLDLATNAASFAIAASIAQDGKMPSLACPNVTGVPDIPIWSFTTTPEWLKLHGTDARAWLAATREGLLWAMAHPTEAAALFSKIYPEVDSPLYDKAGWAAAVPYFGNNDTALSQTSQSWSELASEMHRIGLISKIRPLSSYYTNDFLPR
ncbi:hypothetical protein AD940_01515 [Gluconobacter thailandicus]|uniref:ABC transporter substrate-binding protein n=1 Tax=Gluconobacter thailandicus TaxID=257438 RepID=UPI0007779FD0|nr:ABC transporter substrate-binding protein [Gluconobacter thailandicus]KXV35801.1 hypothetical protein AD940_01515 [Gluconobacter thailandicus]